MILDIPNRTTECVQYAADNVDRTNRTRLDDHNTCHGKLMIAAVTPGTRSDRPIIRIHVTSFDVAFVGSVQRRTSRDGGSDLPEVCQL